MKIAFIYDVIYPFVKGGIEKRVWEIATRLSRNGHEVHIFGMKFWDGEDILISNGVFLHGVCRSQNLYSGRRRSISQALYFGISLIYPMLKEKFDILDCQQFPYFSCFAAKSLSKLKKIPLVITWHEVWGDYWYEYLGWFGFAGVYTERLVARLTTKNVAVSKTTAKNLEILGRFKGEIKIIPNGVDFQNFSSIPPSDSISDIIFVGRLIKEKHVDLLIHAFHILLLDQPDCTLMIIGDGPERDTITALIHESCLETQVRLIGFQERHDEIIAHMKASKICVLPSTREGFGITALEALACGLPVVTVNHPANAIHDLITERNGFLCAFSAKDLADKISLALKHHSEMRNACIMSAASYDWDRITLDIESYYKEVTGNKK